MLRQSFSNLFVM